MSNIAVPIFTGIIIAAVSSWITVQLSLKKFRTEKLWERKVDAYSKIIEALHNSKIFSEVHLDAIMSGREVPEERDKELRELAKRGNDEILKAMDVGAFLLSGGALQRLKQFQEDSEKVSTKSWVEYLEEDLFVINSCLKDFIQIANIDLRN